MTGGLLTPPLSSPAQKPGSLGGTKVHKDSSSRKLGFQGRCLQRKMSAAYLLQSKQSMAILTLAILITITQDTDRHAEHVVTLEILHQE